MCENIFSVQEYNFSDLFKKSTNNQYIVLQLGQTEFHTKSDVWPSNDISLSRVLEFWKTLRHFFHEKNTP